ncbi:MAG: hypothetical protein JEZ07_02800 [Phycisphaerae bacterium]|nr:hypothetical protein [Phycisphaerae bacterium]
MKDLTKRAVSNTFLYGLLTMSAALTVKNILVDDRFEELTDKVHSSFCSVMGFMPESQVSLAASAVEFSLAAILLGACGLLLKVSVRQSQARKLADNQPDKDKDKVGGFQMPFGFLVSIAVVGAVVSMVLLFASHNVFEKIYHWLGTVFCKWCTKIPDNDFGRVIYEVIGVLGMGFALMLYMLRVKLKHGPILHRIEVDGYAWLTEKLAWKNWVISRKVKFMPGIGKAGVHLPGWATNTDPDERINASVVAKDFPDGKNEQKTYISYFVDKEPIADLGGEKDFIRNLLVADGKSKTLVRRARLEENEKRTEAKSRQAFGDDYAESGKCLFCSRFSIKRGGLEDGDEDYGDEDDAGSGMTANSFEQWDKMGLRKMIDWGEGYKMIYRSHAFDIDMDFFASYYLWAGKAIRRMFYVRDANNDIVAKVCESHVWRKVWPILDNDWRIDIYDPELAEDESFGFVLTLMTQYLRKSHLYRENACIKELDRRGYFDEEIGESDEVAKDEVGE